MSNEYDAEDRARAKVVFAAEEYANEHAARVNKSFTTELEKHKEAVREACEIIDFAFNYEWERFAGCAPDDTATKMTARAQAFTDKWSDKK